MGMRVCTREEKRNRERFFFLFHIFPVLAFFVDRIHTHIPKVL